MRAAHRVSLAIALGLTAVAEAQQRPPAAPQFKTGVELIQVDAVVIDAEGRHVRGLKAADFELRDRGKPQTIAAFEEITHERPRGEAPAASDVISGPVAPLPLDVASNQTVQSERLVVLVIDDLHIWTGRTDTAKKIARDVLDRLGRDASMAVLFTSGERSTQVTQDHAVLFRAIDSLEARQSLRRPTEAIDSQRGMNGNLQSFFDNMSLFETVENAAAILGRGDATRKAFVLVSEGLMKNPTGIFQTMRATEQAPQGGSAYVSGNLEGMNPHQPPGYHDYALIDMMEAMRRSNVTTYAIDPRGEITAQEVAYESHPAPEGGDSVFRWNNPVRIAQDGLTTVAEASGGFAVVNTDDFTGGITRIVEDLDHYYLLGFYPADPGKKGYKQLDVGVAGHPDWTVRFRHGYRTEKEKSKAPVAKTDRDALMALSAGALPKTDLALRLGATPLAGDGREVRVALAIEVSSPVKGLEDADGKLRDELRYEVLAVNERKKKVTSAGGLTARAVLSKTGNTGPAPDMAVYQISDTITLEPGTYQLRVSADSKKLGTGGSVYLHLTVPDLDDAPIAIGGIALGYAQGERVASASVTRARSRAQRAGRIQTVELPPAPPPLPFAATLDRTFTTSDVVRIYFEVARKDRRAPMAGTLEVGRLGDDQARLSLPFTPDERGRVMLQLPMSRLTAGRYALRATVTSGAHTAVREMGVTVTASSR